MPPPQCVQHAGVADVLATTDIGQRDPEGQSPGEQNLAVGDGPYGEAMSLHDCVRQCKADVTRGDDGASLEPPRGNRDVVARRWQAGDVVHGNRAQDLSPNNRK